MRSFIEILLKVCTIAGVVVIFIPLTNVIMIKWLILSIIISVVIILWLITIILNEGEEEGDCINDDKVYITDIEFDKNEIIIYFLKNQIYHVDALVCIYENAIPDSKLVALGEVVYCENNYTKIRVIKTLDKDCFKKFRNNRKEMNGKLFVITSFKKRYIDLLN